MTCSITAQLKGKLLVKCELPEDLQQDSNEILGWVLPATRMEKVEKKNLLNRQFKINHKGI